MGAEGNLFEAIKSIGAVVGLITGGFIVFDRLMRNRPYVSFRPREDERYSIELLFHNVSDEGLVIEHVAVKPHVFNVAYGKDILDTIKAAATLHYGDNRIAFVNARSTVALPIVQFNNWEQTADNVLIYVSLRWRSCSSRWLWTWPISIRTTVGALKKLGAAAQPREALRLSDS